MSEIFNVYCDESCHLEHDQQKAMVLGAIWCSLDKSREIAVRLREIKQKHGLAPRCEVKWTKVSPAKTGLYLDLVDYFFDADNTVKVWSTRRRGEKRICLWFEQENYLVILADRGEYILPWTAYLVEQPHRQRKLQREYEEYCRNTRQKG